ncbi:MAG: hypothetical protein WC876_01585 [Candidatus Thermoplasmatota archaeon]|jgi:hypothetical protein
MVKRLLADAAILVALAPALLFFMGWHEIRAYQHRLGLHDDSALPQTPDLLMHGLTLLLLPIGCLAVLYVLIWVLVSRQEKRLVEPFDGEIPLFPFMVAASWLAATFSVTDIGDGTRQLIADFTLFDLVVTLIGIVFASALAVGSLRPGKIGRLLMGDTVSGTIVLVLLLIAGLVLHASSVGADEGSDHAWGCTPYPGVRLQTNIHELDANKTYLLVSHENDFHYIRNPDLPGNITLVVAVPDQSIHWAIYVQGEPVRKCDS